MQTRPDNCLPVEIMTKGHKKRPRLSLGIAGSDTSTDGFSGKPLYFRRFYVVSKVDRQKSFVFDVLMLDWNGRHVNHVVCSHSRSFGQYSEKTTYLSVPNVSVFVIYRSTVAENEKWRSR
jgi:hypothetical protein